MTPAQMVTLWRQIHARAERLHYVMRSASVYAWDIGPEVAREARRLAREVRRYREAGGAL